MSKMLRGQISKKEGDERARGFEPAYGNCPARPRLQLQPDEVEVVVYEVCGGQEKQP